MPDYFTKWAEAITLQNQTAVCIAKELIKLCATYGLPEIVHSDQGRPFESISLTQTLEAIGPAELIFDSKRYETSRAKEWLSLGFEFHLELNIF